MTYTYTLLTLQILQQAKQFDLGVEFNTLDEKHESLPAFVVQKPTLLVGLCQNANLVVILRLKHEVQQVDWSE